MPSNVYQSLPRCLFRAYLPGKLLKALVLSFILATCSAHVNVLDSITLVKALGINYEIPHCKAFSYSPSFLGPKFLLQVPVSNILSWRSPLNIRDYVTLPNNTSGNIIPLSISILKFSEITREDKSVWTE